MKKKFFFILFLGLANFKIDAQFQHRSQKTHKSIKTRTADVVWTGNTNRLWSEPSNWDVNVIPSSTDAVLIPNSTNHPLISATESFTIKELEISANASLEIGSVNGVGSTLSLSSFLINDGSLIIKSGSSIILLGSRNGSGTETYYRTMNGNGKYNIITPVVNGPSVSDIGADFVYAYENSSQSFVSQHPGWGILPAKGYFIASKNPVFDLSMTGTLFTGSIGISVDVENSDGFNLIGNPYTAAISVSDFFANNINATNITGTIYFWDDGGQNVGPKRGGDYITVNSMGVVGSSDLSDGVGGLKGASIYDGYILGAQGFFIEATQNGLVSITEDMQVVLNNDDDHFYRKPISDQNQKERTTIKITVSGNGLYQETLIGLDKKASFNDDYSMDARKFPSHENFAFYSLINDKKYAIQALPLNLTKPYHLKLGFSSLPEDVYFIEVKELTHDVFDSNFDFKLEDNLTGRSFDLLHDIKIRFKNSKTTNDERFTLVVKPHLKNSTLSGEVVKSLKLIRVDEGTLELGYIDSNEIVNVYDYQGKVLFSNRVNFHNMNASIDINLVPNSLYLIQVKDEVIKFEFRP